MSKQKCLFWTKHYSSVSCTKPPETSAQLLWIYLDLPALILEDERRNLTFLGKSWPLREVASALRILVRNHKLLLRRQRGKHLRTDPVSMKQAVRDAPDFSNSSIWNEKKNTAGFLTRFKKKREIVGFLLSVRSFGAEFFPHVYAHINLE